MRAEISGLPGGGRACTGLRFSPIALVSCVLAVAVASACGREDDAMTRGGSDDGAGTRIPATEGAVVIDAKGAWNMPRALTLHAEGEAFRFTHLRPWVGWSASRTRAFGRYRFNTCNPSCASTNYARTRVRVSLSRLRVCASRASYRRLRYNPHRPGLATATLGMSCSGQATRLFYSPDRP